MHKIDYNFFYHIFLSFIYITYQWECFQSPKLYSKCNFYYTKSPIDAQGFQLGFKFDMKPCNKTTCIK